MPILGSFGGGRGFGRGGAVKPLPPTINSVTDVGTDRAFNNGALSISVTPNANGPTPDFYNFWAVASDNSEIAGSSTSSTTLVVGGLASNVQYTVKVVAVVSNVASEFATFNTPTLVTTVPAAPTIGTATDVGTGRSVDNAAATVTFTAGASGGKSQTFKVYTSNGTERGSGSSSPLTASGIDTSFNSSYAFNVRAVNANGTSQASSNTANVTLTTTPGGPSIELISTSGKTINFSFSVPTTGGKTVTSTRIYVMSDGVELATKTISAASGTNSITVPELTVNAFLWGQATNANGAGGLGTGATAILPTGLPSTSVARPNMQNATVTITNYNADIEYTASSASGSASRIGNTISVTGTTRNSFNVTIVANQGVGFIDRTATATVPASTTPGEITGISVNSQGGGIATISWNSIFEALRYKAVLTGSGGSTSFAAETSATFDGLTEGGTYSVTITAYSGTTDQTTVLATGSLGSFTVGEAPPPFFPPFFPDFPSTYNVTVSCNDGVGCPSNTTHTGSYTISGSAQTRPQHSFDGYSVFCGTTNLGLQQPGATITCAGDISLSAQWTATAPSQFKRCTSLQVQFGCNSISECCSLGEGEACSSPTSGCSDFA